ncbi:MAG: hypothetical protein K6G62_04425, partial [Eubacterium sp.]|nr:hypothetical protein [Eubacterium sp.]
EDEYSQLTWDLLNKKISEDKFYEFVNKHAEIEYEYQSCLRVIKKKIDYVKKDPKRRYVIKTDGWFFYFNDNLISFLILIFLMIMTIPIMRIEYLPEMKSIRSLSVLGHKKSFLIQLLTFIVVGEFFMLTSNLLKLLIYHLRYGLESWDAPLQSIELFEKCKWNISIGNLVLANILLQGIGVIFFCLLSAMVVSFLEKNMESFFSILILLLVPPMFFSEELQSKIPNPYTYLFSSELLKGYRFNDYFVSGKRLLFYILLSIVLMFAFLIIALKKGDYVEK